MSTDSSLLLPGYDESFFAPLRGTLTADEFEMVRKAYWHAEHGHKGQLRANKRPYFEHPKAAAEIYIHELGGRDSRIIADILLHDLLEDTDFISSSGLLIAFGSNTTLDVVSLTRLGSGEETVSEYIQRIIDRGLWAIAAKLCEHLHNMRTLNACDVAKRIRKRTESQNFHKPILVSALRTYGPPWESHADYLDVEIGKALDRVSLHEVSPSI